MTISPSPQRWVLGLVVILLALGLWLPLWSTRLESPQYQGDEALEVQVYAGRVTGDLKEIAILNQYIGVQLPLDPPELRAARWVLAGLMVVALAAACAPVTRQRQLSVALCSLMLLALVGAGGLLQFRLYQMGHQRGPATLVGVADFTPPLLGAIKIANFAVRTRPELGALLFLVALALSGWVAFGRGRQRPPRPQ